MRLSPLPFAKPLPTLPLIDEKHPHGQDAFSVAVGVSIKGVSSVSRPVYVVNSTLLDFSA